MLTFESEGYGALDQWAVVTQLMAPFHNPSPRYSCNLSSVIALRAGYTGVEIICAFFERQFEGMIRAFIFQLTS